MSCTAQLGDRQLDVRLFRIIIFCFRMCMSRGNRRSCVNRERFSRARLAQRFLGIGKSCRMHLSTVDTGGKRVRVDGCCFGQALARRQRRSRQHAPLVRPAGWLAQCAFGFNMCDGSTRGTRQAQYFGSHGECVRVDLPSIRQEFMTSCASWLTATKAAAKPQ